MSRKAEGEENWAGVAGAALAVLGRDISTIPQRCAMYFYNVDEVVQIKVEEWRSTINNSYPFWMEGLARNIN